jgi:arsenical-resistance protein 2
MTDTNANTAAPAPWYNAYPAVKAAAPTITRAEVLDLLRNAKSVAGKDFVLVDLRRNDHEVETLCPPRGQSWQTAVK